MHRYPGTQPFSSNYRKLFFGRSNDILNIRKLLNVNNLVVLFGRSGLGKSSLINAGLIPIIKDEKRLLPVFIRFTSFNGQSLKTTLKTIFLTKIQELLGRNTPVFLDEVVNQDHELSLWQWMKTTTWNVGLEDGVLLIMDQFEEIFTYPKEQITEFIKEFSEITNDRMPEEFREALYTKVESDELFLDRNYNQIDHLDGNQNVKGLIGIRSDKLSLLNDLSPHIPNILKNNYDLRPLDHNQAREAIISPALMPRSETMSFVSPPFRISESFLDEILAFLSRRGDKKIETFLLQIICQHLEEFATDNYEYQTEPTTIRKEDIPDLEEVVRGYYINTVEKTSKGDTDLTCIEHNRLLIRYLIEQALIDRSRNNRISLDRAIVQYNGITSSLIERLINERVIRQEPNTVSGISYELSHDSLISPIITSEQQLGRLEDEINSFYRDRVKLTPQTYIEKYHLTHDGKLKGSAPNKVLIGDQSTCKKLIEARIIRKVNDQDIEGESIEVYPMFLNSILQYRAELNKESLEKAKTTTKNAVKTAKSSIIALVISLLSLLFAFNQMKKVGVAKSDLEKTADSLRLESSINETLKVETDSVNQILIAENSDLKQRIGRDNGLRKTNRRILYEKSLAETKLRLLSDTISEYAKKLEIKNAEQVAERIKAQAETKALTKQLRSRSKKVEALFSEGKSIINRDPTQALRIFETCYKLAEESEKGIYAQQMYDLIGNRKNVFYTKNLIGHRFGIQHLELSEKDNENLILSSSVSNYGSDLLLWNFETGELVRRFKLRYGKLVTDISFVEGNKIASASSDRHFSIWSLQGERLQRINMGTNVKSIVDSRGKYIYLLIKGTKSGQSRISFMNREYKIETNKTLKEPLSYISGTINPELLVSSTPEQLPVLWDVNKAKPDFRFQGCEKGISNAKISPDGNFIVANCQSDGVAILWEKSDPQPYRIFESAQAGTAVGFGQTGNTTNVFVGTDKGHILQFSNHSKWLSREFVGHSKRVTKLSVSKDSKYLITGSDDQTIKIWKLRRSELRMNIINSFEKKEPLEMVLPMILRFLSSDEVSQLNAKDKDRLGISD